MPTGQRYTGSEINYLNKDFREFKRSLIQYAQTYYPDSYQDFNETSPGMMLMEMSAYVGDVLSFYIDQQYREMLLPLAQERRNIVTMAKMFGFKVKPIVPAYVNLTFTSEVGASTDDASKVNYKNAGVFDKGIIAHSSTDTDIQFLTLEPVDFTISQSGDTATQMGFDDDSGIVTSYELARRVKAISAETKTIEVPVTNPVKFRQITIPDTNVIDIISVVDSNGNHWHEVDYLAQDKVILKNHYTEIGRDDAYSNFPGHKDLTYKKNVVPVPYTLEYVTANKRFVRETNLDNSTRLVFGNGILKAGQTNLDGFVDLEQTSVVVPGSRRDLDDYIDPLLGDVHATLGEIPQNTTLRITYRIGGGANSNVGVNDLTTFDADSVINLSSPNSNADATILTVKNEMPARGGRNSETTAEIKEQTKAFFSTQNRCVTKEDYAARVLNMGSQYGSVAKVYVTRNNLSESTLGDVQSRFEELILSIDTTMASGLSTIQSQMAKLVETTNEAPNVANTLQMTVDTFIGTISTMIDEVTTELDTVMAANLNPNNTIGGDIITNVHEILVNGIDQFTAFKSEKQQNCLNWHIRMLNATGNGQEDSVGHLMDNEKNHIYDDLINPTHQKAKDAVSALDAVVNNPDTSPTLAEYRNICLDTLDELEQIMNVTSPNESDPGQQIKFMLNDRLEFVKNIIEQNHILPAASEFNDIRNHFAQAWNMVNLNFNPEDQYPNGIRDVYIDSVARLMQFLISINQQLNHAKFKVENVFQETQALEQAADDVSTNLDPVISSVNDHLAALTTTAFQMGISRADIQEVNALISNLTYYTGNIQIHLLSYDGNKNLVGNPLMNSNISLPQSTLLATSTAGASHSVPSILKNNIKNYLENFKMLTDDVQLVDGYIINFGVFFSVISNRGADKQQVKSACIHEVRKFFSTDKMRFCTPLYVSDLEYVLMSVPGVQSLDYVTITQEEDYNSTTPQSFDQPLYYYSVESTTNTNEDLTESTRVQINTNGTSGYGWKYDFQSALYKGVILPPSPDNPGVFELKNPNQNIKGVVL